MSVVPGKSSQKFIESTHEKIQRIAKDLKEHKFGGYIEADGGILEYVAIDYLKEGPIVMVRMLGACAGCAMSAQTMTMGIEKLVKERFPEVQRVISV